MSLHLIRIFGCLVKRLFNVWKIIIYFNCANVYFKWLSMRKIRPLNYLIRTEKKSKRHFFFRLLDRMSQRNVDTFANFILCFHQ